MKTNSNSPDGVVLPPIVELPVAQEAAKALLPAWARLLIYLPTALVIGTVGNVVGSIPGIAYLFASGTMQQEFDAAQILQALPPWAIVLIQYCTFAPVVGLTLLFARLVDRRRWDEIGLALHPWTGRDITLGIILGATVVAHTLLYALFGLVELSRTGDSVLASVAYGLLLFVGVGFWEELIFRGYVLPNLEAVAGRVVAVIGSSVLFWAVHMTTPEARHPLTALGLIFMGVLFAICYYRTGSLWLPIALHASYDFFLVSLFQPHPQLNLPTVYELETRAPEWLVGPPGKAGVLDLAYLLLLFLLVFGIVHARPFGRSDRAQESRLQPVSPPTQ